VRVRRGPQSRDPSRISSARVRPSAGPGTRPTWISGSAAGNPAAAQHGAVRIGHPPDQHRAIRVTYPVAPLHRAVRVGHPAAAEHRAFFCSAIPPPPSTALSGSVIRAAEHRAFFLLGDPPPPSTALSGRSSRRRRAQCFRGRSFPRAQDWPVNRDSPSGGHSGEEPNRFLGFPVRPGGGRRWRRVAARDGYAGRLAGIRGFRRVPFAIPSGAVVQAMGPATPGLATGRPVAPGLTGTAPGPVSHDAD